MGSITVKLTNFLIFIYAFDQLHSTRYTCSRITTEVKELWLFSVIECWILSYSQCFSGIHLSAQCLKAAFCTQRWKKLVNTNNNMIWKGFSAWLFYPSFSCSNHICLLNWKHPQFFLLCCIGLIINCIVDWDQELCI